jgi:hypothetical protein
MTNLVDDRGPVLDYNAVNEGRPLTIRWTSADFQQQPAADSILAPQRARRSLLGSN